MNKLYAITTCFAFFSVLFAFVGCLEDNPTKQIEQNVNYMPLRVGDTTQLLDMLDSGTILFAVIGKTNRTDGEELTMATSLFGSSFLDTEYYYINDGIVIYTEKDTIKDDTGGFNIKDPFGEQWFVSPVPVIGQYFYQLKNDTSGFDYIRYTSNFGICSTYAGVIENTIAMNIVDSLSQRIPLCEVLYADDIGYIGSNWKGKPIIRLSYAKHGINHLGVLFPAKNRHPFDVTPKMFLSGQKAFWMLSMGKILLESK